MNSFRPQINEREPINKKGGPVYERLFDLSVKNAQKKDQNQARTPKTPGDKPGSPPEKQTPKNHRGKPIYEALSQLHQIKEVKQKHAQLQ